MGKIMLKNFSFKLSIPKIKRESKPDKAISNLLYALSFKDEDGIWKAKVNTKNILDYPHFIICEFTEKSHQLKGKNNLFSIKKDNKNHYIRYILTNQEAMVFEGSPTWYSVFCENNIYCGYLIKDNTDNKYYFDMKEYIGDKKYYEHLLE